MTIETANTLVGLGTALIQGLSVLLIALYFFKEPDLQKIVEKFALPFALLVAAGGVVLSLIYSEYFGIAPCGLCWLQRVALYPQVLLFGVALWIKDKQVALYSIGLSLFGAVIALYQHYLQMGGTSTLPCPASGASDCAQRFLFELGYITFPLASFSVFVLLIILMLYHYKKDAHD